MSSSSQKLNYLYFDIETRPPEGSRNPFSPRERRKHQVLSVAWARHGGKPQWAHVNRDAYSKDLAHALGREKELLEAFPRQASILSTDILVGWNSRRFDSAVLPIRERIAGARGLRGIKPRARSVDMMDVAKEIFGRTPGLSPHRPWSLESFASDLERALGKSPTGKVKLGVSGGEIWKLLGGTPSEFEHLKGYALKDAELLEFIERETGIVSHHLSKGKEPLSLGLLKRMRKYQAAEDAAKFWNDDISQGAEILISGENTKGLSALAHLKRKGALPGEDSLLWIGYSDTARRALRRQGKRVPRAVGAQVIHEGVTHRFDLRFPSDRERMHDFARKLGGVAEDALSSSALGVANLPAPAKGAEQVSDVLKGMRAAEGPLLHRVAPYAVAVAIGADLLASRQKTGPFWGAIAAGGAAYLSRGANPWLRAGVIGGTYLATRLVAGALQGYHDSEIPGFGERGEASISRKQLTDFGSGLSSVRGTVLGFLERALRRIATPARRAEAAIVGRLKTVASPALDEIGTLPTIASRADWGWLSPRMSYEAERQITFWNMQRGWRGDPQELMATYIREPDVRWAWHNVLKPEALAAAEALAAEKRLLASGVSWVDIHGRLPGHMPHYQPPAEIVRKVNPTVEIPAGDVKRALHRWDYENRDRVRHLRISDAEHRRASDVIDRLTQSVAVAAEQIGSVPVASGNAIIAREITLAQRMSGGKISQRIPAGRRLNLYKEDRRVVKSKLLHPRASSQSQTVIPPKPEIPLPSAPPSQSPATVAMRERAQASWILPAVLGGAALMAGVGAALLSATREATDYAYSRVEGALYRRGHPRTLEGFQNVGFSGAQREQQTDFGTGWDAARGLARALKIAPGSADVLKEVLAHPKFMEALEGGRVVKTLSGVGEGMSGAVHLMETEVGGEKFRYVRKLYNLRGKDTGYVTAQIEGEVAGLQTLQGTISPTPYGRGRAILNKGEEEFKTLFMESLGETQTLDDLMKSGKSLSDQQIRSLREGVETLHRRNLTHSDINPNNILIDRQGRVSLIDPSPARLWGGSAGIQDEIMRVQKVQDTMALERLERKGDWQSTRIGLWSITNAPPMMMSSAFTMEQKSAVAGVLTEIVERAGAKTFLKKDLEVVREWSRMRARVDLEGPSRVSPPTPRRPPPIPPSARKGAATLPAPELGAQYGGAQTREELHNRAVGQLAHSQPNPGPNHPSRRHGRM
jgi:hypothetical protein